MHISLREAKLLPDITTSSHSCWCTRIVNNLGDKLMLFHNSCVEIVEDNGRYFKWKFNKEDGKVSEQKAYSRINSDQELGV